jgi:hypothetical protein
MLATKHSRQPVFPFVARAIHAGAAQALGILAEVDPALADRVRPYGHRGSGPFPSAWETLITRCDSLLSPVTLATMSGTDVAPAALLRDHGTIYLQIP